MKRVTCPRCRKDFVRRSPLQGRWDHILGVGGIQPFHCQLCGHRFRARGQAESLPADERMDRREYARIPSRLPAAFSWEGGQGEGTAIDLSITGCSLEVEASIAEGDLLQLQIQAEANAHAIAVEAAVVRYAGPWRVGLQFLRIQAAEQERLRDLLHRLVQEYRAQRGAARLGALTDGPTGNLESGLGRESNP